MRHYIQTDTEHPLESKEPCITNEAISFGGKRYVHSSLAKFAKQARALEIGTFVLRIYIHKPSNRTFRLLMTTDEHGLVQWREDLVLASTETENVAAKIVSP